MQAFGVGASADRGQGLRRIQVGPRARASIPKTAAPCSRSTAPIAIASIARALPSGPDLFGIRNQPKEAILLHILIPEYEITQGFAAYVVETKDGRTLTGLIASETPTSVTLRQALGKEETVLRSDIEQLVSSKLSLMPQELEKAMTRQELADLISYLKGENRARPVAELNDMHSDKHRMSSGTNAPMSSRRILRC